MTTLLTVCAVWVCWGASTGVQVRPGVARTFDQFVHRGAHTIGVLLVWQGGEKFFEKNFCSRLEVSAWSAGE